MFSSCASKSDGEMRCSPPLYKPDEQHVELIFPGYSEAEANTQSNIHKGLK